MKKAYKNEKGFTAVEGLLVILILVVISAVGYMVYHNNHKTKTVSTTTTSGNKQVKTTAKATATANPYAGWSTYTDTSGWFTFKYPTTWTNNTAQAGTTVSEGPNQTPTKLTSNGEGELSPTAINNQNESILLVSSGTYTGTVQQYIGTNGNTTQDKSLTINGYQAHYGIGTNDGGDSLGTYEIFKDGKVAILNFLISTPNGNNYSSYESVESQIANSVQFVN